MYVCMCTCMMYVWYMYAYSIIVWCTRIERIHPEVWISIACMHRPKEACCLQHFVCIALGRNLREIRHLLQHVHCWGFGNAPSQEWAHEVPNGLRHRVGSYRVSPAWRTNFGEALIDEHLGNYWCKSATTLLHDTGGIVQIADGLQLGVAIVLGVNEASFCCRF